MRALLRRAPRPDLLFPVLAALVAWPACSHAQERPSEDVDPAGHESPPGAVEGRVVLPTSGEAVPGATVYFLVNGVQSLTDEEGRFRFEGLDPGPEVVQVVFLDQAAPPDTIVLPGGVRLRAELEAPAVHVVEVEEMVVRVRRNRSVRERRLEQFDREARSLARHYLDRDRLDEIDPARLSWTLRRLGLSADSYDGRLALPGRGPTTIFGRRGENHATFSRQTGGLRCVPALIVDGAVWGVPDLYALDVLDPDDIEGMALYRGPLVPARFRYWAEGCGALVVWRS